MIQLKDRKAPKKHFRVIGVDTFDGMDWIESDFKTLKLAKQWADAKSAGKSMLVYHIYDDGGNHITNFGNF